MNILNSINVSILIINQLSYSESIHIGDDSFTPQCRIREQWTILMHTSLFVLRLIDCSISLIRVATSHPVSHRKERSIYINHQHNDYTVVVGV